MLGSPVDGNAIDHPASPHRASILRIVSRGNFSTNYIQPSRLRELLRRTYPISSHHPGCLHRLENGGHVGQLLHMAPYAYTASNIDSHNQNRLSLSSNLHANQILKINA
eukprot:3320799-Pyramimonas_sp.AAC.1